MKYEIKGIEKGKTIKSVQIVNSDKRVLEGEKLEKIKVIMVNYLDGTQDVFEFNKETLNRIKNMVDTQAKTFVDKQKDKFPWLGINVGLAVCGGLFITVLSPISAALMALIVLALLTNATRLKIKENNLIKHQLYVDKIMGKLEEYNDILRKENALSKSENKELVNIINIDKKSIKELEHIGNKIERYNEIEGKSPKKKSL